MRVLDLGGNSLLELPLEVGSLTNLQVCVMLLVILSQDCRVNLLVMSTTLSQIVLSLLKQC